LAITVATAPPANPRLLDAGGANERARAARHKEAVMEGVLFFLGSIFIEGVLGLLLMMVITEPARNASAGAPPQGVDTTLRKAA
jgi:hypothetical protein